jgi:hypothetical protein
MIEELQDQGRSQILQLQLGVRPSGLTLSRKSRC